MPARIGTSSATVRVAIVVFVTAAGFAGRISHDGSDLGQRDPFSPMFAVAPQLVEPSESLKLPWAVVSIALSAYLASKGPGQPISNRPQRHRSAMGGEKQALLAIRDLAILTVI